MACSVTIVKYDNCLWNLTSCSYLQYAAPDIESIELAMTPACKYGTQNVANKCGKFI